MPNYKLVFRPIIHGQNGPGFISYARKRCRKIEIFKSWTGNIRVCFNSWQSRVLRDTRSLATFVHSHRSLISLLHRASSTALHALCSLALFTGSLTHFAQSLVGQFLNSWIYVYAENFLDWNNHVCWRHFKTRPDMGTQTTFLRLTRQEWRTDRPTENIIIGLHERKPRTLRKRYHILKKEALLSRWL